MTSRMLIKNVPCARTAGRGGKYHNKQTSDPGFSFLRNNLGISHGNVPLSLPWSIVGVNEILEEILVKL